MNGTVHVNTGHEWVEAWLIRKSGPWAWVQFTTRGPEVKVPAVHVKEEP